jgi:hypothetical protein
MKIITLNGKTKRYVFVDDEDYEAVSKHKWCVKQDKSTYYARTQVKNDDGTWIALLMHRLVVGVTDPKIEVDHRNHRGFVNLKTNLRVCSHADNMRNQQKHSVNTSGFKGVSWNKHNKNWRARIKVNYKNIHLGCYTDKIDAAKAYNDAAIKYFGHFACLNII